MNKGYANGYVMQEMNDLFDELNTDTMNLRILWQDVIVTRNHINMQTALATGFEDFGKGWRYV